MRECFSGKFNIAPTRICGDPGCGKTFDVPYTTPFKLYCNRACSRAAARQRNLVVREERTCALADCGKTFTATLASQAKHCSDLCQKKARYRGQVVAQGRKVRASHCCR